MRISKPLCALCALVLAVAGLAPAGAQAGMQPVSDARGLFTISIPADWRVANNRLSDTVFQGLRSSTMGRNVLSTLAAHSLRDDEAPGILAVAAVDLPRRVSPALFGEAVREELPAGWAVTQDGRATIAGRDAYYVYFIMQGEIPLYMVLAYFNVGKTGFLVIGGTPNESQSIRKNFATISHILETFHPSPKLGTSP